MQRSMKHELVRKGIHAGLALGIALLALWVSQGVVVGLGLALFVVFGVGRLLGLHTAVAFVPRVSFGELFFALGVVAAALAAPQGGLAFQYALLVLALADPLAGLVGMRFGRRVYRILGEQRSLEGSAACFAVGTILGVAFGMPLLSAFAAAFVLTGIEALAPRGSDNLFLPTAAVVLATALL